MKKKLLLWDIDGTIVTTAKAGEFALISALKKLHGLDLDISQFDLRGKTDRLITQQILQSYGIDPTPSACHDFLEAYLEHLPLEISKRTGTVFPGVLNILEQARQREDLVLALLTGNLRKGAQIKLTHYEVWHYFEFGAFADDSPIRNELGPFALDRAAQLHGVEFDPRGVFIIGDTPLDIECGKVIGARTIAVCTGGYSRDQLSRHCPDAVFEDLSDAALFFRTIDSLAESP